MDHRSINVSNVNGKIEDIYEEKFFNEGIINTWKKEDNIAYVKFIDNEVSAIY